MSKQFWRQINLQYNQEDFLNVYKCSGLQALFVAVFYTSVDLLCKNSYKSNSLLGYFDCFQSTHIEECCNINCSGLCQIKRGKMCFASSVSVLFCARVDVSLPLLANFSSCNRLTFCFSPLFMLKACWKSNFFQIFMDKFEKGTEKEKISG